MIEIIAILHFYLQNNLLLYINILYIILKYLRNTLLYKHILKILLANEISRILHNLHYKNIEREMRIERLYVNLLGRQTI